MTRSHTHAGSVETGAEPASAVLELVGSAVERNLPEALAGRVHGHLAVFADHMRKGLLAASTAVGLEVMSESDGGRGHRGTRRAGQAQPCWPVGLLPRQRAEVG